MVQRLPSPGLLPTSQEGGVTVHDNSAAMTAPGSAPGFDGGIFAYPQTTDRPVPPPPPVPVSDQKARAPVVTGGNAGGGTFAQASGADNASRWKRTPSAS